MTHYNVAAITAAIQAKRCLLINCAPGVRLIEPHTLGRSKDGALLMRAYQVSGASASGEPEGWKIFRLDRLTSLEPDDTQSAAPRNGYKRGDKGMRGGIISEI